MAPHLQHYFDRIGYEGSHEPTLDTLCAVHSHHARAIPYEAIDVFLERPVDQDIERIFEKIVLDKRGGWCYEMNGLLGWALREIGFDVARLCGGVMRAFRGDEVMGNHLVLKVDLEGTQYIADVGLGDANLWPFALEEGEHQQGHRTFNLERLEGDMWRCINNEGALPPTYDFSVGPVDEARLATVGQDLQDDPNSMFRQNLTCQLMSEESTKVLIGRVFAEASGRVDKRLLHSREELLEVLDEAFGLHVPNPKGLWERVVTRHEALFGLDSSDEIQFFPTQTS